MRHVDLLRWNRSKEPVTRPNELLPTSSLQARIEDVL